MYTSSASLPSTTTLPPPAHTDHATTATAASSYYDPESTTTGEAIMNPAAAPLKSSPHHNSVKQPSFVSWLVHRLTTEYLFYCALLVVLQLSVFYVTFLSQDRFHTGELERFPGLDKGWFMGRTQDTSDPQYASFRNSFPLLVAAAIAHLLISRMVWKSVSRESARPHAKALLNIVFGMGFLFYCYGPKALFVLAVFGGSFALSGYGIAVSWVYCFVVLVSSKWLSGYSFTWLGLPWLDQWESMLSWEVAFNISFCRLISFTCDYTWALQRKKSQDAPATEKPASGASSSSSNSGSGSGKGGPRLRQLEDASLPVQEYNLLFFFAYVCYIPLYLGGPVLSYNAFVSQLKSPQTTYSFRGVVLLAVEMCGWFLALEVFTHLWYYDGINDNEYYRTYLKGVFPAWEIGWGGFFTLHFMWTKFMVIWRFFRVWAMFDGVETHENMERWIHNNFTFAGFWRGWHSSLNKWIVRYMYVPMGGQRTQTWTMWIIFTFVGLWHDLWWRWIAWAWMNALFFTLEILFMRLFTPPTPPPPANTSVGGPGQPPARPPRRGGPLAWMRQLRCWNQLVYLACAFNIIFLCLSNLAIPHGFEGIWDFIVRVFFSEGSWKSWLFGVIYYYVNAAIQVEYRRWEERTGKGKNY